MKIVFYIVIITFFLVSCSTSLYSDYTLSRKYPQDIPALDLQILSDTTGIIMQSNNRTIKQDFEYIKKKRNFIIITYSDTNRLGYLNKGDTLVYHKKELYLINEKHKLFFYKKE